MKANELMIGDWILCHGEPTKVSAITDKGIDKEDKEGSITPIPLTLDLMEKNGWEENKWGGWYKDDVAFYPATNKDVFTNIDHPCIEYHPYGCVQRLNIRCDYVHILQRALRLCGLNKIADNFKI